MKIFKMTNTWSILNFDSVHGEEDLQPRPGFNLNHPPRDGRCDCCGKHISELKSFGKAGDPLVGDFYGAYLVKTYRTVIYYDDDDPDAVNNCVSCR